MCGLFIQLLLGLCQILMRIFDTRRLTNLGEVKSALREVLFYLRYGQKIKEGKKMTDRPSQNKKVKDQMKKGDTWKEIKCNSCRIAQASG